MLKKLGSTAKLKNSTTHKNSNIQSPKGKQNMKLNKVDESVIAALKPVAAGLTLQELADQTGQPSKKVFKSLKKLFENEMISSKARKYTLLTDKPPVKAKDDEAPSEEE
jgi:predicted transcriptional regulator